MRNVTLNGELRPQKSDRLLGKKTPSVTAVLAGCPLKNEISEFVIFSPKLAVSCCRYVIIYNRDWCLTRDALGKPLANFFSCPQARFEQVNFNLHVYDVRVEPNFTFELWYDFTVNVNIRNQISKNEINFLRQGRIRHFYNRNWIIDRFLTPTVCEK